MPDVPQAPQQMPPTTPPPVVPPVIHPTPPPTPPPMPPPVPKPPTPPPPPPQPPKPVEVLPPIPPPAPTPAPAVTPLPQSSAGHKFFGALVVIVCILILAALGFIFWPKLNLLQQPQAPAPVVIPITTSTEPEPTTAPPAATSTATAATTTTPEPAPADDLRQSELGDTVVLFQNDDVIYLKKKGEKVERVYEITALEFSDSRCPQGVQCIWAGERGVKLRIESGGESQDFYLGMVRATSVKTMGVKITLIEIDDGKGGTYAKIRVD